MTTSDPWQALGVRPGASPEEVARAFRRSAARHHPDAGGDPERFREVLAARDRLLAMAGSAPAGAVHFVRSPSRAARLLRPLRRRIDRRLHPRVR